MLEEDGLPEIGIQHHSVHLIVGPDECGICFSDLTLKRQIRLRTCGHSFHRSCAVNWREAHILFDGREEGRMQCVTCRQSCDDMWDDLGWLTTWTSHGPSGHPDVMLFIYYLCTKETWQLHLHLESLKIISECRVKKLIKDKLSAEEQNIGKTFISDCESEVQKLKRRISLLELLMRDLARLQEDISNGITRRSLMLAVAEKDCDSVLIPRARPIPTAPLVARDPPAATGARGEAGLDPVPPAAIKAAAAICLYAGFASSVASSLSAAEPTKASAARAATTEEAAIAELLQPSFDDNVAAVRSAADDAGRGVDAALVTTAAAVFRSAAIRASSTRAEREEETYVFTSSQVEHTFIAVEEKVSSCLFCGSALSIKRSVTVIPCGHVVHRSCLMRRIDEAMECLAETGSLPTCSCGAIAESFSHPHATERVRYWGMHENQKRRCEKDRSKEERLILSHRRLHCRHTLLILAEQRRQALRQGKSAVNLRDIEEERVQVAETYHSIIQRLLELCEAACKNEAVRPLYIERFSIAPPLQTLTIKQRWEHARKPQVQHHLTAKSRDIEDEIDPY